MPDESLGAVSLPVLSLKREVCEAQLFDDYQPARGASHSSPPFHPPAPTKLLSQHSSDYSEEQ